MATTPEKPTIAPIVGPDDERVFTDSGIEIKPLYTEDDVPENLEEELGRPGDYPFTRGIHERMYRDRRWTMRQYAGYASAKETNERFHYLIRNGSTGLSMAFDLPTQLGRDSDDPLCDGEVGRIAPPEQPTQRGSVRRSEQVDEGGQIRGDHLGAGGERLQHHDAEALPGHLGGDEHIGPGQQVALGLLVDAAEHPAALQRRGPGGWGPVARQAHLDLAARGPDGRQCGEQYRQPLAGFVEATEEGDPRAVPAAPPARR